MEEQTLIEWLKRGDLSAFKHLLDMYQRKVLTTCYRFVLNRQDAEDIAQEVFIEVFNSINDFRRHSKLSTWIYRIAVTKSLDEIRKRNRQKRISSVGRLLGLEEISFWFAEKSRPDTDFEQTENWDILLDLLNTLPENQRIAFTLSKIDAYHHAEVAEIMQLSVVAVDSLVYRAKQNLKIALANWNSR
jgi:RNA polymerase sigma-70 factor (ECF subfamily)